MVLGTGLLLLLSLIFSAVLAALGEYAAQTLPGGALLWQVVHVAVSLALTAGLFALIYRVVPDAEIAWRDALVGGAVTAVLFGLGKLAIGIYLGRGAVGSAYGAAGALLVLLVWVYYSAQILFLGAEFTQVYANRHGARVLPETGGAYLTQEKREQEGTPRREPDAEPRSPGRGPGAPRPSPG
jgi:membrane protein